MRERAAKEQANAQEEKESEEDAIFWKQQCPVILTRGEFPAPTVPPKAGQMAAAAKACAVGRVPQCSDMGAIYNDTHRADKWNLDRMDPSFIGSLKGAYVFDVGGNTGRDSEQYLEMEAEKVFIFEPIKDNVKNLKELFQNYSMVTVLPYGLGKNARETRIGVKNITDPDGQTTGEDAFEVGPDYVPDKQTLIETIQVDDIIPNLRRFVPSGKRVFLSMNCEGCEFEVSRRLSEYDGGSYLRNGTIAHINFANHAFEDGIDVSPGSEKALDFCGALPFYHMYYQNTYCDGPWMGFLHHTLPVSLGADRLSAPQLYTPDGVHKEDLAEWEQTFPTVYREVAECKRRRQKHEQTTEAKGDMLERNPPQ